jgi:SAM-dependent methyltransferase
MIMQIAVDLAVASDNTIYTQPTVWRQLGAKYKAENIMTLASQSGLNPNSVLEVGAGDGAILNQLSDAGFGEKLFAVELSKSGVEVISSMSIARLVSVEEFDGYHLPFKDSEFDLVVLSHVLEHVEFERALLREIKRVSKFQIIEIPMDWTGLENPSNYLMWQSYGHINAHSPASLRFLLATEGFQVKGDLLSLFPRELAEYDFYVNNSRSYSLKNRLEFQKRFVREFLLHKLRRTKLSERASTYTVLTESMTDVDVYEHALKAARLFISQGRPNLAQLIADKFLEGSEGNLLKSELPKKNE